jgi:DMSO reductase family type II enzyme heme b subunit
MEFCDAGLGEHVNRRATLESHSLSLFVYRMVSKDMGVTVKTQSLFGVLLLIPLLVSSRSADAQEPKEMPKPQAVTGAPEDIEAGKRLYQKRCSYCHGDEGKGDGPAADFFTPRPRDFTSGLYKYRSTPTGQMPRDEDLLKTISRGLPGTGMPNWDDVLKDKERMQVIQYIKTFSRRFGRLTAPPTPIAVGKQVSASKDSIARGKELYKSLECFKCHGDEGRGDGPSAPDLKDDFGFPVRARNLTRKWYFRGGHEPEDIYLRFNTGLAGTPMPSFATSLDNEKSWDLANYVVSLSPAKKPELKFVVKAKRIAADVPEDPQDPRWDSMELFEFPLVGQVTQDAPRDFTAMLNDMDVKAVYNDQEIAVMLVWDDPTQSAPNPETGSFSDMVAIQFPNRIPTGATKPYFLMGDSENPVNLWKWKSDTQRLFETNAWGMDKEIEQKADSQNLKGKGVYHQGQYRLVFKRALRTADVQDDIQFEIAKFIPIAFNTWDGSAGDTGKKRSVTAWYYLFLEPPVSPTVYVYPSIFAVVAIGLEWWIVRKSRNLNWSRKKSDAERSTS